MCLFFFPSLFCVSELCFYCSIPSFVLLFLWLLLTNHKSDMSIGDCNICICETVNVIIMHSMSTYVLITNRFRHFIIAQLVEFLFRQIGCSESYVISAIRTHISCFYTLSGIMEFIFRVILNCSFVANQSLLSYLHTIATSGTIYRNVTMILFRFCVLW